MAVSDVENENSIMLGMRVLEADKLQPYYKNPHVGDIPKIAASLRKNKQYRPIVVNIGTKTGRPFEVLAGNHTWRAVQENHWPLIDAVMVDVDEDEAARINVVDNRTGQLGHDDRDILLDVLGNLDDLEGTGYSQEDVDRLLNPPIPELPDDDEDDLGNQGTFGVLVVCDSLVEQNELAERFAMDGLRVRPLVV